MFTPWNIISIESSDVNESLPDRANELLSWMEIIQRMWRSKIPSALKFWSAEFIASYSNLWSQVWPRLNNA